MSETVVRIRPSTTVVGRDAFDQPVLAGPDEAEIPGALVAPKGSTTVVSQPGREPVLTATTLYFRRSSPDIAPGDRVRVRGVEHDVDGEPAAWPPRRPGGPSGLVVTLRDPEG
ncbi:MAG: hypothetical protein FWH11_01250 [Micrococcales bacterium]|nr:hypothetical protein [Micrococcales bacterium]